MVPGTGQQAGLDDGASRQQDREPRRVEDPGHARVRSDVAGGRRRGWPWFLAVVAVSLGLWALVIWAVVAVVRLF